MPQLLQRAVAPSRAGGKSVASGSAGGKSVAPGSAALGALGRLQRAIGNRELARLVGAHRERSAQLDDEIATARGGGHPVPASLREPMGRHLGIDLGGVKLHTDERADRINRSLSTVALTAGDDIFLRSGRYRPHSLGGQALLAHELTHVAQQRAGQVRRAGASPLVHDPVLESQAHHFVRPAGPTHAHRDGATPLVVQPAFTDIYDIDKTHWFAGLLLNLAPVGTGFFNHEKLRLQRWWANRNTAGLDVFHSYSPAATALANAAAAAAAGANAGPGAGAAAAAALGAAPAQLGVDNPYFTIDAETYANDAGRKWYGLRHADYDRRLPSRWLRTKVEVANNGLRWVNPLTGLFGNRSLSNFTGMFVQSTSGKVYAAPANWRDVWNRFHSSLTASEPVRVAGEFTTDGAGRLTSINNQSGHYRPSPQSINRFLESMQAAGLHHGVDMSVDYYGLTNITIIGPAGPIVVPMVPTQQQATYGPFDLPPWPAEGAGARVALAGAARAARQPKFRLAVSALANFVGRQINLFGDE